MHTADDKGQNEVSYLHFFQYREFLKQRLKRPFRSSHLKAALDTHLRSELCAFADIADTCLAVLAIPAVSVAMMVYLAVQL
jgi:hypothetical protein